MAGYWPNSLSQLHDQNGLPIRQARAYFYAGGTTTPIEVYRDYGLTTPHTNPLQADGNGIFPAVFLDEANNFYRVRVTTPAGVLLYDVDSIPIIGPSGGGGGPPPAPVDPDSVMKTGDVILRWDTGLRTGFVRINGRTIGSATSGASERANADCQPLYEHLWNLGANVTGGRGASAAADWSANKPLVLPDIRGRAPVGLDTMGNIAAGVLSAANFLNWFGGEQTHTLTIPEMPAHDHQLNQEPHNHNWGNTARAQGLSVGSAGAFSQGGTPPGELETTDATIDISMDMRGGGLPHNIVQPSLAFTFYIRL